MNLNDLITEKCSWLKKQGIATSRFELRLLLADVLEVSPLDVLTYIKPLSQLQNKQFEKMLELRCRHYPVDKIIGHKGFYKYEFITNTDVLSPRPETELLVENAIFFLAQQKAPKFAEFGVGSGCVIISVLAECTKAHGIGIDISEKALTVAAKNATNIGVNNRIKLYNASWFDEHLANIMGIGFDVIISNPPYIPSAEIINLEKEVKDFDPLCALDGGKDGLRDYRQIAKVANLLLKDDGRLLLEVGENQAQDVVAICNTEGLTLDRIVHDLSGVERCIILKK